MFFCIYLYVRKHYDRNKIVKPLLAAFMGEFGIDKKKIFSCSKLTGDSEVFHTQNGTLIAINNEGAMVSIYTAFVMRTKDNKEWIGRLSKDFANPENSVFKDINMDYQEEGDKLTEDVAIYNLKYTIDFGVASDNLYSDLALFIKEHEPKTKIMIEMEVMDSKDHYILQFQNDALIQCWAEKKDEESMLKKEWLDEKWWSLNFVKYNKEKKELEVKSIQEV